MTDPRAVELRARRGATDILVRDEGRALLAQIAWFNRMRFVAVLGMSAVALLAQRLGVVEHPGPLLGLAGLTLVTNLGYLAWSKRLDARRPRSLRRHIHLQIGIDLLILTAILHESGGVTNPFALAYLFHTLIAAFLLSLRASVVVAVASLALLVGLALLETSGALPHLPLRRPVLVLDQLGTLGLVVWLGTITVVLGLSIYFVSTVLRQLSRRDRELVDLSRQLALSEKLASVGTLAAGVSHEINNPVGVIQNKAGILRYRIADGDEPAALLAELDVIEKHTRRIGAITQGLLAFAREGGFQLRPLRVNALVEEGADLVRVPFKVARLGLDLRLDPADPRVSGSPNHLLQVLVNVLLNARDASPAQSRVSVATSCDDAEVRIRIRDQGTGIPPEILDKIFDPFFTTKEVDRGTGLGLALSHGIVERHAGRIVAENLPEGGACFTIALPRCD
ncbi:MAG: hypothetical protein IPM29_10780 [Planctomycetes bacterium]|nr:hypothetical protein [Planctomycetota bacterium]